MGKKQRTNILSGIFLIFLGGLLMVYQLVPGVKIGYTMTFSWPMLIIMGAFALLIIGLLTGTPEMLIPACTMGGIGGILYWQNVTGNWTSWAYVWALIPGFVGVGTLLSGVIQGERKAIREGLETLVVSAVLFVVFGALLGGLFESLALGTYWPVLLIVVGIITFVQGLFSGKRRAE